MFKLEILDEKENLLLLKEFKYQSQLEKWLENFKHNQAAIDYIGQRIFTYFFINDDKIIPLEEYTGEIEDPAYLKFKNDKVKRRRGLLRR